MQTHTGKDDNGKAKKVAKKLREAFKESLDTFFIFGILLLIAGTYLAIFSTSTRPQPEIYTEAYEEPVETPQQRAEKIRQLEEYNAKRLATSRALVDSGEFVAAYKIMERLPDSLLLDHEMKNVIEPGLRQAITGLDAMSANTLLASFLMRTQDSSYVQVVKALNTYSNVTEQLSKVYRDTAYAAQELRDMGRARYPMRGYIVQKISDYLYECRHLEGWSPERVSRRVFLLKTVTTVFTSKGRFALYLRDGGTRSLKMTNGFTEEVQVLIEDTEAEGKNRLREKKERAMEANEKRDSNSGKNKK